LLKRPLIIITTFKSKNR